MTRFQLDDKESQLLQGIYAAALAPEKWQAVLIDIVRCLGADNGYLLFYDSQHPARNILAMAFHEISLPVPYVLTPVEINQIKELFKGAGDACVVTADLLVNSDNKKIAIADNLCPFFTDIKALIPLVQSERVTSSLGLHAVNDTVGLSREAVQLLQRLAPHISRALHIYNQVSAVKRCTISLVESLKCSTQGVLLLDAELHVLFSTAEAQRILANTPALYIGRYGQLEIGDFVQQTQLDKQLRKLLASDIYAKQPDDRQFSLPVHIPDKVHPIKITAMALTEATPLHTNRVRIGIFINDPERLRLIPQDYLQQAYGLTRTEAQIAQLLLDNLGVAAIAARRGTSLETTRWQIKSLLQKTSTKSQVELIRLLMLLSNEFIGKRNAIPYSAEPTFQFGDAFPAHGY